MLPEQLLAQPCTRAGGGVFTPLINVRPGYEISRLRTSPSPAARCCCMWSGLMTCAGRRESDAQCAPRIVSDAMCATSFGAVELRLGPQRQWLTIIFGSSCAMDGSVVNLADDAPRTFTAGPVTKSPAQSIVSDHHRLPWQPARCDGRCASCSAAHRSLRHRAFTRCITRKPGDAPCVLAPGTQSMTPHRALQLDSHRPASTRPMRADAPYAAHDCAHMSRVWQARPVHHLTGGSRIHRWVTPDSQHQHTLARESLCPGGCAVVACWSCLGSAHCNERSHGDASA